MMNMRTMKRLLPVLVLSMLMVLAVGMMSAAYAEPIEDYEMAIKSVKAVDGGYKVTWNAPDIEVDGFRVYVEHANKYYQEFFVDASKTSKLIKKVEGKSINMFKYTEISVKAYKVDSSGKKVYSYGDYKEPRVQFNTPINEHADDFWYDDYNGLITDATKYVYDGKKHTPKVTVKYKQRQYDSYESPVKVSSKYYTRKYSKGRKAIGKYKVTVTLKGNYKGTAKGFFYITPKPTSLTSVTRTADGLKVKWKKQTNRTDGYQVFWSYNYWEDSDEEADSYYSSVKLIKSNKTTSTTLTKCGPAVSYQVAVRTYKVVNKKKIYSKWSKPVVIKKETTE